MPRTLEQILAKLDQPPAAHNWARCNHQAQARTTSSLVNLALGFPQVSYRWATIVIQNVLADGLNDRQARKNLDLICPTSQFDDNLELLDAFLEYNASARLSGFRVFDEFSGKFMAGPDVTVPVRPTIILNNEGVLKPLFIIGWATNSLKYYQRRLLSSLYEDAIYSLTDLRSSPGEVLLFSRNSYGARKLDRWERGTYEVLSKAELQEQVYRFTRARADARPIIADRFAKRAAEKARREAEARAEAKRPPRAEA